MNKRIGLIRASVVALGFAVLGPAIAESQILVICGVYRDSYADTDANLCHGRGTGCMECTISHIPRDTKVDFRSILRLRERRWRRTHPASIGC